MKIVENKFYIVRTTNAGVFFGKIKEATHEEVTMTDVRKLWHWDGACAVEELALNGTTKPGNCKITVERWFLREEADILLRCHRIFPEIDTIDEHISFCLRKHTADNVHNG